jgi:4-hydroxybenzoate polyprenyltransferase
VLAAELASRVTLNPEALPYDHELIGWLEAEHLAGRRLWLCAASNETLAGGVARHLAFFEGVLASDRQTHFVGEIRATQLAKRFGAQGFDYCGDTRDDIPVWKCARTAIVVRGGRRLEREVAKHAPILRSFPSRSDRARAILRALRLHQWAKNGLTVVPLLTAHRVNDRSALRDGLIALGAFCICASSGYILNDLLDLEADRVNPRKSTRPFAAGLLSLQTGCTLAPLLFFLAFAVAMLLPPSFSAVLASYYVLTLAYSFALKGIVLLDALTLAGLYTLRLIAGAVAVGVPLSFWLLLFSVFLFLSLAFVNRFAELDALRRQGRLRAIGRGYEVTDLPVLRSFGGAAGYLSVLVLALYIRSPEIESLYHRPKVIWGLCLLLLFWISRVWMTAQRGRMHDDPVVFALKDWVSLGIGLLAMIVVVLAL